MQHRLNGAKEHCFVDWGICMLQARKWNDGDERSLVRDRFEQNWIIIWSLGGWIAGRRTVDHLRGQEDRYFHDLEHLDSRLRKYLKGYVRSQDRWTYKIKRKKKKKKYRAAHKMNMADSFVCKIVQLIGWGERREMWQNLSHFSLLLRHGSQLIAFRARFVGGRPSVLCSPEVPGVGEVLPRTTPTVDDLACFGREAGVCKDEGGFGSDIVARKVEERWEGRPDRKRLLKHK